MDRTSYSSATSVLLVACTVAVGAVAVCAVAGAQGSGEATAAGCEQTVEAVAAAPLYLIARDNARDLAGVLAGYTEDVVWLPPQGGSIVGKAAIRQRYEAMFANVVALESDVAEAVAAGEWGFARGSTRGTLTAADGARTAVDGTFVAVTRCEQGRWRVARLIWNDAAEPKAEPSSPPAEVERENGPCELDERYSELDFWVGSWDVEVDGFAVGKNSIQPTLGGCAVVERWTDRDGRLGMSLFYVDRVSGDWKQVWVTDGGMTKEKRLVERFPGGGVRFQGTIRLPSGKQVLDRTTLTPLEGGRARQVIEQSDDGGAHWSTGFDAVYVPAATE